MSRKENIYLGKYGMPQGVRSPNIENRAEQTNKRSASHTLLAGIKIGEEVPVKK